MIIFLVVVALVLGVVALLIVSGKRGYRREAKRAEEVSRLDIVEAEKMAFDLLLEKNFFAVIPNNSASLNQQQLPLTLQKLFERYERISGIAGPLAWISLEEVSIHKDAFREDFFEIGRGMEGTDTEYVICIRRNDDRLYEVYEGEKVDPIFGTHKSVFHWIVSVANEQRKEKM